MKLIGIKKNDKRIIFEMAYIDKVTGIGNKNKFIIDSIDILLKKENKYAAVVLEICNFEVINELFGFEEGNAILKYTANIIKENVFEDEAFARASAGKFNLLIKYDDDEGVKTRLEMIMDDISEYKRNDESNSKCSVSAFCGIYIVNDEDIYESYSEMEFNISHIIGRAKFALLEVSGKYKIGRAHV